VLQRAPEQALSNFTASLKRAVLALAPPKTVEEAQHEAMQDRRVVVTPLADGMAQLWALLPAGGAAAVMTAGGAAAVMTAVNALADRVQPDDPRCVEQRRADALVQTGIDVLTGQNLRRAAADLKWTSPTGHVYVKPAATYPIDRATTVAAQASSVDPDPPPF
jgi:hypothetical protein